MNRRELLKCVMAGAATLALRPAISLAGEGPVARFAALEHKYGGRLGVAVLDTASGHRFAHRGDERFLICSTFKLLLVAAVLKQIDGGVEKLDRRIVFDKDALLEYAPVTKQHAGPAGMTVAQLCKATIIWSDNTAANLLLMSIGGPIAVTKFARSLGDQFTLVDRIEPALNPYDTTTPSAMLGGYAEAAVERCAVAIVARQAGTLVSGLPDRVAVTARRNARRLACRRQDGTVGREWAPCE